MQNAGLTIGMVAIGLGLASIGFNLNGNQANAVVADHALASARSERQGGFSKNAGDPECRIAVFEPVALDLPTPWVSSCAESGTLETLLFVDGLVEGGCTVHPPRVFFDSGGPGGGGGENEIASRFYTGTGIFSHDPPLTVTAGVVDYESFLGVKPRNVRTKAIADVDGDGWNDLVIEVRGVNGESKVGYLKNLREPRSPLAADLDGDCVVGGADLGLLLVEYGNTCD